MNQATAIGGSMLRKSTVSVIWLLVFVSAYAQTRPMHIDESLPLFKSVFEADRNWVELTPRLTRIDLLKVNEGELKKILSLVNSAK